MKTIESHINVINASASMQEIFERFVKVMHGFGYDQVFYGHAPTYSPARPEDKRGHISNFPAEWLKHYAKNNLADIDPVNVHGLKSGVPAYWSQCVQKASPVSIQLMRDAADAGLKSGIIIPIYDASGEISMVSVSCNTAPAKETYEQLAAVSLVSSYFHQGYKSFLEKPPSIELSPREYEILNWAAEGKTDAEISIIIGLSTPTVRYHWKNLFKKFNAYKRVHVISKAIKIGLVTPYRIVAS